MQNDKAFAFQISFVWNTLCRLKHDGKNMKCSPNLRPKTKVLKNIPETNTQM